MFCISGFFSLHHPDGVGTDGVVKIFPFNLFFSDVLWKVCAQERYVGPFVLEKKSSLTMKEGLSEVVRPDLSDNCLQRSDSKYFKFLALDICPVGERLTNTRVQETAVSRLPPHADSGRARYRAIVLFVFLGDFSMKRPFLAERTATKPLRVKRQTEFRVIPCVSACFRLFPSVSVCFRLTLPGNYAAHHRDPCPSRSGNPDALLFFLHSRVLETETQRRRRSLSRNSRNSETWHALKPSSRTLFGLVALFVWRLRFPTFSP